MTHIETIRPEEKIQGYAPPVAPATVEQLLADLNKPQEWDLNTGVWKVKRASLRDNTAYRVPKRLLLPNGKRIRCHVLGSVTQWWFVSVNAADARRALSA